MADDVLGDLIFARLSTDAALLAIIQDLGPPVGPIRIYPRVLPQDATLPAMTYYSLGGPDANQTMGQPAPSLQEPRFQVSCWHQSYHEAKRMQLLVRKRLRGYSSPASAPPISAILVEADNPDLYEEKIVAHMVSTDFVVWYLEQ